MPGRKAHLHGLPVQLQEAAQDRISAQNRSALMQPGSAAPCMTSH